MLQCLITIVLYYHSVSGSGIKRNNGVVEVGIDENNDLLKKKLDV